ncbi:MAG: hypothetical protein Q7U13_13630 [Rhodoferax sp.]|nr:hypothetical protein [Rhodoferax sp.]
MKFVKNALLACISLGALLPHLATATPVTLTTGNMQFANPTTVHIANQTPLVKNLWVYSGAIAATASDTAMPFEAWCIDIFQHAYFNWSSQDYVRESATVYPGSDKANSLLRLATESLGLVVDSRTSSAFQLATWEIVNETSSTLGLSSGNFTAWGASDDSIALANSWLSGFPVPILRTNTPSRFFTAGATRTSRSSHPCQNRRPSRFLVLAFLALQHHAASPVREIADNALSIQSSVISTNSKPPSNGFQ